MCLIRLILLNTTVGVPMLTAQWFRIVIFITCLFEAHHNTLDTDPVVNDSIDIYLITNNSFYLFTKIWKTLSDSNNKNHPTPHIPSPNHVLTLA